jgi:hypothetical protein
MAHEDRLIDYLSKEIETQSNNLMAFRERINFAVFVGPFVLLGATLYGKGLPHVHWSGFTRRAWIGLVLSSLFVILSYLTLGSVCCLIEIHIWNQCNKWRKRIAEISSGLTRGFTPEELEFKEKLRLAYKWVYLAMLVAFVSAMTVVLILWSNTPVTPGS